MQHARPVGPTTNAAATFEPSMVQGCLPDRPSMRDAWRAMPMRAGWHSAQPTHVQATVSSDMVSDARPQTNRQFLPPRCDYDFIPPDIISFSIEMVLGWRPASPRLFLAPKIPLPVSQTTHDAAPFGVEMAQGQKPDRNREVLPLRVGLTLSQTTEVSVFSPEMVAGSHPDQPRPFTFPKLGWIWSETTAILAMTPEMFGGNLPDRARPFLAPRIPQPLAQPTHVAAPITLEMFAGSHPDSPRLFKMKVDAMQIFAQVIASVTPTSNWIIQVRSDVGTIQVRSDDGTIEP